MANTVDFKHFYGRSSKWNEKINSSTWDNAMVFGKIWNGVNWEYKIYAGCVKDGSAKTITFTLPSDGKYSIYFYKDTTSEGGLANANIRNLQLEKSNEATPYTQHFKTTLLIPDSDRNLPCFGYGINETVQNIRDYENDTYTQMVAEVDLGDLSWTYNADGILNKISLYCLRNTVKVTSMSPHLSFLVLKMISLMI